jgi:hypothetical protein
VLVVIGVNTAAILLDEFFRVFPTIALWGFHERGCRLSRQNKRKHQSEHQNGQHFRRHIHLSFFSIAMLLSSFL